MARVAIAAIAAACVVASNVGVARAQEAPTPGGDVTADEATPLPPVVVQSPSEPIAPRGRAIRKGKVTPAPVAAAAPAAAPAIETGEGAPIEGGVASGSENTGFGGPAIGMGVFTLGQLDMIGGSTITNEAMWTFNKNSLDQAVSIIPGVSSHNSGGARNERDVYVRGFDRYRVPLSIDGVRIYLPADNRLDLGRFLTADLSEVQVQKGYVSILNGPGGLGGSINLVSRKPTKEIELEGRSGAVFNGDLDSLNQWSSYAYAGTRQKFYYAQVSGAIIDQDHFSLSHDFQGADSSIPGYQASFPYQQGGDRDRSNFQDWRINAKVGITPNATDEYSVNYTNQQSEKGAPLHTDRQIVQGYFNLGGSQVARYWDWPEWNVSTLSWLSKTQIGEASYIKTNAFYNTFDNTTSFYPNSQYLYPQIDSPYSDHSTGGFIELGTNLIPMNTLKGVVHYREDVHNEGNINYNTTTGAVVSVDPRQTRSEETWSFGVENTFHATRNLDFVAGVSYDMNKVLKADGDTSGLPLPDVDAWNGQGALIYRYTDTGTAHVSISSRTRFPTLFERYSTRFGSKTQNPDLQPERATNYEVGFSDTYFRALRVSSALFYSDLKDSIQNAFAGPNGQSSIIGFNADGENYGFEISADYDLMRGLRIGGNYTYLERNLNYADAALTVATGSPAPANAQAAVAASQVENSPRHEAFIYLAWNPMRQLTLTPSIEIASDRTALITSCGSTLIYSGGIANNGGCPVAPGTTQASARPNYARIGSYTTVNFQAEYEFDPNTSASFGATNIFDQNYELADGFPEPGRQFFANFRAKF